ncbi:hypothetical protein RchiOBHm_Chr1g0348591 [Rosa chinensis]|uniref:Uncharacterized protein n=1 Tax=Rosa chinensis TaxID=74649 RepID=A0A2P6SFK4_ROSCH|nr:hypothetical protein RchiOBHm_Chr1g0348591 [Rosa chinensis]
MYLLTLPISYPKRKPCLHHHNTPSVHAIANQHHPPNNLKDTIHHISSRILPLPHYFPGVTCCAREPATPHWMLPHSHITTLVTN